MCVSVRIRTVACMLLFVLFKHNTLLPFIAYTYFTTFPALEREEDQTSSVVNFLPEHNLESMPHRKPYSHMDKHKHTRSKRMVGWKRRGEGERAREHHISQEQMKIFISAENFLPFKHLLT